MAEIVHLGPRQQPPGGEYFVLIERRRGSDSSEAIQVSEGLTLKIEAPFFEEEFAGLKRKLEAGGAKKLYVRDWLRTPRG